MATDTLDNDIYSLISYYGFKRFHSRLVEIMKDEYTYLHSQFQPTPAISNAVVANQAPVQEISPPAETKKPRKQRSKKTIVVTAPAEPVSNLVFPMVSEDTVVPLQDETPEIKEVVLVPPTNGFRDPKDVKEYQRKAEETKKKENDALGIQVHSVLTKENLKQWVENEGHTYAWVAREKAGCPDTQVAATAQMMGIKSKISKKRGMIMSGN